MKLKAELRTEIGSSASRRLRAEGKVPVTLYSKDIDAISLTIDRREFNALLNKEGINAVFDLEYDGNEQKVFVRDFDKAALKDIFYNVDLLAVSKDDKLEVEVPVYTFNDETIKVGIVELITANVLVESTPDNIPASFDIDVTGMEIGDVKTVADLEVPENVEVLLEADEPIVSIAAPTDEPIEVDPDAEVAEPEVITAVSEEEEDEDEE